MDVFSQSPLILYSFNFLATVSALLFILVFVDYAMHLIIFLSFSCAYSTVQGASALGTAEWCTVPLVICC